MRELTDELRERLAVVRQGGSPSARERHTARGKLLVRDRVDRLLDPGSAFLELSPLAAHDLYGGDIHSAGIVTGVGRVAGRGCGDRKSTSLNSRHATISDAVFCL